MYSDSESDEGFVLQEDAMIKYDEIVTKVYNMTVPDGRFVLSTVNGNFEKAYDVLQKTADAQQYLADIGAIRVPNIDRHALIRFCANPSAHSNFQHSRFISMLPYAIIREHNLEFVTSADDQPLCAQDAQLHAVCSQSQNPASCYEHELGLRQQSNSSSSVVLSKQLIRFMCHNVNRMLVDAQNMATQAIDALISSEWGRFEQIKGQGQLTYINVDVISEPDPILPALSLRVSKNDYIAMLRNEYGMSKKKARTNMTADTFRDYAKRQFKNLIIVPHARRLEDRVMKNNRLWYMVTAS